MVFTHTGRVGDFFTTLPIYSAWYKKYNEPVTIVVPENFPFAEQVRTFALKFDFIKDFVISSYRVWHFDMGGVPYIFNPNEYGVQCDKWFNLGFKSLPNKFAADFCAEDHSELEVDLDFKIDVPFNPNLYETYKKYVGIAEASGHRDDHGLLEKIIKKSEVDYHWFDPEVPFWETLIIAKHCKYNVLSGSALAILLSFAKIPFAVYTWQTPPNLYYRPSPDIFSIWAPPSEILKSDKSTIVKYLNLGNYHA